MNKVMTILAVKDAASVDVGLLETTVEALRIPTRARQMRAPTAKRLHLLGRLVMWFLLYKATGHESIASEVSTNKFGKPVVNGYTDLHFNVSHSGEWVVGAICDVPVGVDVEEIKPVDLAMMYDCFDEQEIVDILERKNPQDRLRYFYDIWTLKESYVKANGKGLAIPTKDFVIRKTGSRIHTFGLETPAYFSQHDINPQCVLSTCCLTRQAPVQAFVSRAAELIEAIYLQYTYLSSGDSIPISKHLKQQPK
jgi:4'-phosphopantetheinyl transferase